MSDAFERVVLTSESKGEPEGHAEKMIALVDSKAPPPAGEPARPDWLPAKFKTVEEMAKSYTELESKLGAPKAPEAPAPAAPADAPETPPVEKKAGLEIDPATEAVTKAGLDMTALSDEYATSGDLTPESYAKLAAAGIDKSMVETYIAGRAATQAAYDNEVMAATPGGADKYADMVTWAKANMTAAQVAAYNTAVSSGDKEQAKLAVAGLGASYVAAEGNEPVLQGGKPGGGATDSYASQAEWLADMKTQGYKTDPAVRAKVMAKLGRSNI